MTVANRRLFIWNRYAADRELAIDRLAKLDELIDLEEPFGRIRAAIEEAQRSSVKPRSPLKCQTAARGLAVNLPLAA